MTLGPFASNLLAFGLAAVVSMVLTPVALRLAVRVGVLDEPGGHKSHHHPTPYLGGLAMVVAFTLAVLAAAAARPPSSGFTVLAGVLVVAVVLAVVGLVDDLRGLGVVVRLGAQLAAAFGLWFIGVQVQLTGVLWLDLGITIVWVVGITNAMNLLDNMDGLSAGIATIAALWFGVIGALNGQVLVSALSFALAGCAVGFLRFNRPPARIYMGDAGSLFLGVVLATIGVRLDFATDAVTAALIPILVLTVPVLDIALVVIARVKHGLSPFKGGRDHISHRLVRLGLPVPVAVGVIAVLGVAHGWMALVLSRVDLTTALIGAGLVAFIDLLLFALLAKVPVYGNSRGRDFVVTERATSEGTT